jgi:hypothetical protein
MDADRRRLSLSLKRVEEGEVPRPRPEGAPQLGLSEEVFADDRRASGGDELEAEAGAEPEAGFEPEAESEPAPEPAQEADPAVEAEAPGEAPQAESEPVSDADPARETA